MRTKQHLRHFIQGRFILSCLCLLLLPGYLLAQRTAPVKPALDLKWQLNATVEGVHCYYRIADCNGQNIVFLKFQNTNNKTVTISWNEAFVTKENNVVAKQGSFGKKEMELSPGKTEPLNCESTEMQRNLITRPAQKTPVYSAKIVSFSFADIIVVK